MILMIPLNIGVASFSRKMQVRQMGHKDSRIKLVNEVLNGIKVCYACQEVSRCACSASV